MGWGESGFKCLRVRVSRACVILVLCECIYNEPAVSPVLPDLTIPVPWVLLRVGWSILLVPPWVTSSRFLVGIGRLSLNILLLFYVFLSFLFP